MAKCGIGVSFGEDCGPSGHNEKQASNMLTLGQCKRDISGHLKMLKLKQQDIISEGDLICYRAGKQMNSHLMNTRPEKG